MNVLQLVEKQPRTGYQLIDLGSHWEFRSPRGIYKGSFKQVVTYSVVTFKFSIAEIDVAVEQMETHFQNGAEFGIYKRFMFTFDKETNAGLH